MKNGKIKKVFGKSIYIYDSINGRFWRHLEANRYIEVAVKENNTSYPNVTDPATYITLSAHRLAWLFVHGSIPEGMVVDHINGDVTDYSIANLRLVTQKENARNKALTKGNKLGAHGVYKRKSRFKPNKYYYAVYVVNEFGKSFCLGKYKSKTSAITARRNWERWNKFHANHGRKPIKR